VRRKQPPKQVLRQRRMEASETRRQIGIGLGLVALGVLVIWQVAVGPRSPASAEVGDMSFAGGFVVSPKLDTLELKLLGHIYAPLIHGQPAPTCAKLAEKLKMSIPETRGLLEGLQSKGVLVLDDAGNVLLAPPFSAVPSHHVVFLPDGTQIYASSAWKALAIPVILGSDATLRSESPQFGRIVTVTFGKGRIVSVSPPGALLWIVRGTPKSLGGRDSYLVTSSRELELWQIINPAAKDGFSPAITAAKRTAVARVMGRVRAALEAAREEIAS